MKVLLTGGCGFIGHHFAEHILAKTDWEIIIVDKLTYASMGLDRIRNSEIIYNPRVKVFPIDFTLPFSEGIRKEIGKDVDIIVHMGAESHVDNSIKNPRVAFHNNINGTIEMLEYAKSIKNLKVFFYFSTDEVFGPAPEGISYKEWDRHRPTNPYSASKAAAEDICLSYENTYGLPIMIINVMNVFGERQHVEKFIPMTMKKILNKEKVLIHSNKDKSKAGSRFYIHARNVSDAVLFLLKNGKLGDKYNVVGECEVDNLEMASLISKYIGMSFEYEMIDFHSNRPGHDLRYCLDGEKLKNMGWKPPLSFEVSLKNTVDWTLKNRMFLED